MNKPFDMYSWRKKYVYLAENDEQFPYYDPEKHKTLMRGAIDLELHGDKVVMYLPFKEEEEYAVAYTLPVEDVEKNTGATIRSERDLEKAYDDIYDWLHRKYDGPFSKPMEEDHSGDPTDKYVVKPCDMPGEPWAVWEGDTRVEGFETKEEAEAFAIQKNQEQNLTEAPRGLYYVKVDTRDLRKAHDIIDDMYRNADILISGDTFYHTDPELISDLLMDFGTHDVEIVDDNIDFSDYDGHSDNDEEENIDLMELYERFLKDPR